MLKSSIKRRLTILLLGSIFIVSGLTISQSYYDAVHEINEVFDAELAQSARILHAQLAVNLEKNNTINLIDLIGLTFYESKPDPTTDTGTHSDSNITEHEYERKIGFQIWDNAQNLIFHTQSVGSTPLSRFNLSPGKMGFNPQTDTQGWRVFSIWGKNNQYVLQMGERFEIRQELVDDISRRLITPYVFSLPFLALIIWYAVGRGLQPLKRVTAEVKSRQSDNLNTIKTENIPVEILPLVNSLNDLFSRLHIAFEKEKQFTNDAAHELRTPLAALKTHTQVALKESNPEKINESLHYILNGVERSSHVIDQMLTIARLSPSDLQIENHDTIALFNCVEEIAAELSHDAIKKDIELILEGPRETKIKGNPMLLSILLRNLLHNAIHYTLNEGTVVITVYQNTKGVALEINDSGPGIADENIKRVFDRFYRIIGHTQEGCGLGLSIAKQCAIHLNASIQLTNQEPTGLKARVQFY